MDKTIEDLALEERKFLHDLSNQVVVAQGMSNTALRTIKSSEDLNLDPVVIDKLEKSVNAINKMIKLIKERRTTLHSVGKKII